MNDELLNEVREIRKLLSFQKQVLTLDEFCAYAGISKSYAYHLTSSKMVKCYRPFGKMIYFDKDDVIEFLKQNKANDTSTINKRLGEYLLKS